MAWIKQFLLLWSILHESLASKGSCSKPNFNFENVDMSEIMETRFEVGHKLRLKCQRGYKRKAGTSNLIKCQNDSEFAKWSSPIFKCIRIAGSQPPAPSTSSTEIPKGLTPTIHDTSAMTSLATSVEPALATSVEPTLATSVEPATSGATADHYTSTMDITVSSGSHLSPAVTTITTAPVESTALTNAARSLFVSSQTSSIPPLITHTSGLGLLNTTWTAVRSSTSRASTVGTESPAAVPSDSNQRATAETTVTFSTNSTAGMEAVTTRKTLAERTVNFPTASETTSDIASTIITTDVNQTMTAGKSIGLVIGASTSSFFVILLVILFLVWLLVYKNRIFCTRLQVAEHELTPMAPVEGQTVVNTSETGPLQSETER